MTQDKLALSIAAIMVVFSVGTLATVIITHPSHPVVCTLNGQVVDCPPPAAVVVAPRYRPAYCNGTGTDRLPECGLPVPPWSQMSNEERRNFKVNLSLARCAQNNTTTAEIGLCANDVLRKSWAELCSSGETMDQEQRNMAARFGVNCSVGAP